ncbi:MAG: hypothetical protein HRT88_23045 [Lentisphaeraceae bacterium]|nr:hypothetical protein [Lentisphaeraceae bacterium]
MIKGHCAFLPLLQDNHIPKKQLKKGKGKTRIKFSIKHIAGKFPMTLRIEKHY